MKGLGMKKYTTKIYITLTILWTIIIFSFSLQPADTSSQLSSGFGRWLIEVFAPNLIEKLEMMPAEQLSHLHFLLRKCAHFTEYLVLGVFVMLSLKQIKVHCKALVGLIICTLVASVDETIQLFVNGRSGQISDVLLDSAGAMVGLFFIKFLYFVQSRRHIHK